MLTKIRGYTLSLSLRFSVFSLHLTDCNVITSDFFPPDPVYSSDEMRIRAPCQHPAEVSHYGGEPVLLPLITLYIYYIVLPLEIASYVLACTVYTVYNLLYVSYLLITVMYSNTRKTQTVDVLQGAQGRAGHVAMLGFVFVLSETLVTSWTLAAIMGSCR